jgi:hypothetical protein
MNRRRSVVLLAGLTTLTLTGCAANTTTAAQPAKATQLALPGRARPPIALPSIALPSPSLSIPGTHTVVRAYQTSVPVSDLVVNGKVGDVTVIGTDRSGIEVITQAAYSSRPPDITRTVSGHRLVVSYTCPIQVACGVAFVIGVPNGTAVQASTDTGAIRLTGLAGPVTAKTDAGFIDASALTARAASLTVDIGGIDAEFTSPPTDVSADTKVGAVTIRVPATVGYRIDARAFAGKVTITVPREANSPRTISASTDLGDVSVTPS